MGTSLLFCKLYNAFHYVISKEKNKPHPEINIKCVSDIEGTHFVVSFYVSQGSNLTNICSKEYSLERALTEAGKKLLQAATSASLEGLKKYIYRFGNNGENMNALESKELIEILSESIFLKFKNQYPHVGIRMSPEKNVWEVGIYTQTDTLGHYKAVHSLKCNNLNSALLELSKTFISGCEAEPTPLEELRKHLEWLQA